MQGEALKKMSTETQKKGAMFIVRSLGLLGLYKGAGAWCVAFLTSLSVL